MRALALLAVVLLLGCAAPAPQPSAPASASAPVAAPASLVIGPGSTEASFTIAPDDTTWLACTHGGFQRTSPLYASLDAGATWKPVAVAAQPVPSGDCDVGVTRSGAWAVAYDTVASAAVAVSTDRGATWKATEVAGAPVGGAVDRPWLAVAGDALILTWCDLMAVEPALCFVATSADLGATWSAARPITVGAPGRALDVMGRLTASPDGKRLRIPVAWVSGAEPNPDVTFVVEASDDAGLTWREIAVAGPMKAPPQIPSLSVAPDGALWYSCSRGGSMVSWETANAGGLQPLDADILVTASRDGGKTWDAPLVVAPKQHFDTEGTTWIDAGPRDAVVAWVHARADGKWVLDAARVENGTFRAWSPIPERTAGGGVDYLMTGHDPAGRDLVVVVMDNDIVLARA
ncbi:MAG: repeat-like domain [Thermoplasmata archaeon]|jgi:hypothetical protein|nr:repeat-like domain [Thermoplasmata archaeon]